jgi:hypothetical protein
LLACLVATLSPDYHEKETVTLRAGEPHSRSSLHAWLRLRGFKSADDFYFLARTGRCEPWQSKTVVSVQVRLRALDVYETEEDIAEGNGTHWDELQAGYLLATLPGEWIEPFVKEIRLLAAEFALRVEHRGNEIDPSELAKRLNEVVDELTSNLHEPGSEQLAMEIERQYPRR